MMPWRERRTLAVRGDDERLHPHRGGVGRARCRAKLRRDLSGVSTEGSFAAAPSAWQDTAVRWRVRLSRPTPWLPLFTCKAATVRSIVGEPRTLLFGCVGRRR